MLTLTKKEASLAASAIAELLERVYGADSKLGRADKQRAARLDALLARLES